MDIYLYLVYCYYSNVKYYIFNLRLFLATLRDLVPFRVRVHQK